MLMQDLIIESPFREIFVLMIIFVISYFIAYTFEITDIISVLAIIIFLIMIMYFLGIIELEIGVFSFILLPILIIIICRKGGINESN